MTLMPGLLLDLVQWLAVNTREVFAKELHTFLAALLLKRNIYCISKNLSLLRSIGFLILFLMLPSFHAQKYYGGFGCRAQHPSTILWSNISPIQPPVLMSMADCWNLSNHNRLSWLMHRVLFSDVSASRIILWRRHGGFDSVLHSHQLLWSTVLII